MVPSSFASLVSTFLKEEYDDSPTLASSLGLTEYDERLDDTSASAWRKRIASDDAWLDRFKAQADAELSPSERIDRDLLISVLRGRQLVQPLETWKRQPATYLNPGLNGVFSLFLHRLRPEKELAEAARSRLSQVPRNVSDGIANLDLTPGQFAVIAGGTTLAVIIFTSVPSVVLTASGLSWRPRWQPRHPAITASSMLAKEDVDRMVRDAAEHAEEDRQKRSEAESRNEADQLVFLTVPRGGKIKAVANASRHFGRTPRITGWCCAPAR